MQQASDVPYMGVGVAVDGTKYCHQIVGPFSPPEAMTCPAWIATSFCQALKHLLSGKQPPEVWLLER